MTVLPFPATTCEGCGKPALLRESGLVTEVVLGDWKPLGAGFVQAKEPGETRRLCAACFEAATEGAP